MEPLIDDGIMSDNLYRDPICTSKAMRGKKHTPKNPGAIAWVRKWIIKHHQFLKDLKELWKSRFGRRFQPRDKRRPKRGMGGWTFLEAGPNALWDKRFITDFIDPTTYTFRERTKDFPWPSELLSTGTYGIIWYLSQIVPLLKAPPQ